MKAIKNILIGLIAAATITSCVTEEPITPYRGKVKFETISVSSKLGGRIQTIYVEEGQQVHQGDTLAYIDLPEVSAKMRQADGAIRAARGQLNLANNGATKEQLNQISSQIQSARAQLDFAQESFHRMQAMFQDSLISHQQFDEIKMKRNMAQAQVDALVAKQNEVMKGARLEQIDQAKGQLDRAIGARDEVLSASHEKYIIAPRDMSIETISLKEGELLTPGYALFNGYEKNSVYFRFTVPESKVYDFEAGNPLTLVNPYTNQEIEGHIATIKQLPRYADITSTSPLYQLSESIYELKVIPPAVQPDQKWYMNATILIKE